MTPVRFKKLEAREMDGGQRIEVDVVVPASCVEGMFSELYEALAKVRGVPSADGCEFASKLEGLMGSEALAEARRDFVLNRATTAVVRRLGLDVVLAPGVHAESDPDPCEDFFFTANFTPRPALSLTSVDPVHLVLDQVEVAECDIDEQVAFAAAQIGGDLDTVDDAWVKENLPQFGDVAGFRDYIRADLEGQAAKVERQALERSAREALEKRLVGSIPDELYQQAKDSLLAKVQGEIEAKGASLEQYCEERGVEKSSFVINVFLQASEVLRQNLALDVLARERGLVATEREIRCVKAGLSGAVGRLSYAEFAERGFARALGEQISRKKALDWLLETAQCETSRVEERCVE